ncbi:hypothetical protein [Methanosarcina sp.]|uniref:hypothetical protein n=1 Tax=Methanosarcina sp. TaxID=2213 RepID=UPI002988AFA8|nr:hypothetical protein [Methanosarcina sp.]MDW5550487.1 hypothetical protein [Methanosarcina sp.]MDW5554893.1 hypothetical protein [Methanosarcina sp.]MDW5559890.1 hypothetical protein [Methanosarcina sp.]
MKTKPIIAIALLISAVLLTARVVPENTTDQFKEGKYIHVDNIVIQFKKTDATVNIDYHLSPFAQAYISLFGSKNLESKIKDIFSEFKEVKIQKIGRSSASLQILNISRKEDVNYLCDPYELGVQSDVVTFVYPPKGKTRSYENLKVTPPVVYYYD